MSNAGAQKCMVAPILLSSRANVPRCPPASANVRQAGRFKTSSRSTVLRAQAQETPAIKASYALSLSAVSVLAFAGASQAGETIPAELLTTWLDAVRDLGPLGPIAFVATISLCECVPFFPTQPLSICAGLLFGVSTGAFLNLIGLSTASTIAFTLSRTTARGLAQAVIDAETSSSGDAPNPVAASIAEVQAAIERGGALQQFTAILLLRLTPIVPFSASNYVLGLSPVPYGPFIAATMTGMSVWSVLLASLGAAGNSLLTSGADPSTVLSQVSGEAGERALAVFGVAVVVALGAAVVVRAPGLLPDPEDLGKPEADAEARRLRNLSMTQDQDELNREQQKPLVTARSSRRARDD